MENENNASFHLSQGETLFQEENYTEAKEEFEKALTNDPENAEAHNWLGRIAGIQERYDEAETAFGEAIKLNPENPDYHVSLAVCVNTFETLFFRN